MKKSKFFSIEQNNIFWHAWQLNPWSTAYNLSLIFDIQGGIDPSLLLKAVSSLIHSHDLFKVYFSEENTQVKVHLCDTLGECVEWIDLSTHTDPYQEVGVCIDQVRQHSFDLTKAPLFKASCIKVANNHHFLALCFHHILVDGIAEKRIIEYISTSYHQQRYEPHPLPLPPYFHDRKHTKKASSLFWQNFCQRIVPESNDLTAIQKNKKRGGEAGKYIYFNFDSAQVEKIQKVIEDTQSSWFCFLMSIYIVTLHRLTDSWQWAVCYAVDERDKENEDAIGCFTNVLPLFASIEKGMTFADILSQVTQLRAAQKLHQAYPFLEIAHTLRKLQRSNIETLLNIALIQTHIKTQGFTLGKVHACSVIETENQAIYDLCLEYEFIQTELACRLNYRSAFFDNQIISHFPAYFKRVVEICISSPQTQIGDFSLLEKKEKKKICIDWNRTSVSLDISRLLPQRISDQATKKPKNIALVSESYSLSYAELEEKTNQFAAFLLQKKRKNTASSIVPLIIEEGIDRIIAMLAILKAGLAYAPIDPLSPTERIAAILEDCNPEQVVFSAQYEEKINKAISSLSSKDLKKIIFHQKHGAFSSLNTKVLPAISATDLAYVLYTSGSTGKPKGVKVSHLSLLNCMLAIQKRLGLKEGAHFAHLTPYFFDISALEIYLPLLLGASCFIPAEKYLRNGKLLSALLDHHAIHFAQTTPTTWQLLLDTGWHTHRNMTILSGGENLSRQLAQALCVEAKHVWNLYGPTETTIWATAFCVSEKSFPARKEISIGKPIDNMQVYVLDNYLQPVPLGRVGELYISGLGVAEGYLGKEDLTKACFLHKPAFLLSENKSSLMYKTGDFVKWLPDGNLLYLGRKDEQIKYHGYRIELGDIESALRAQPYLKQAVVLSEKIDCGVDEKHSLVAYYTVKNTDSVIAEKELRHFLSEHLPACFIPHKFIQVAEMPVSGSGKIDRKAFVSTRLSPAENGRSASTKTQHILCQIWQKQFGIKHVFMEDDFYALGGDSLSAIKIAYAIENQFHIECSAQIVFMHSKISDLAFYIDIHGKEKNARLFEKISRITPAPLSAAQKRFLFLSEARIANQSSYNIVLAWRMAGSLDVSALKRSICFVIQRHEILRTIYPSHHGVLSQDIIERYAIDLHVESLSELALSEVIAYEETYHFDFSKQPPYRIRLLAVGEDEMVLLFNFHHVSMDNRALYILMKEISFFYKNMLLGKNHFVLPKPELAYIDFACWETASRKAHFFESSLGYWKDRLNGYENLELPVFHKKDISAAMPQGSHLSFSLDAKKFKKIRAFCKERKVTLFTLLLSTYSILLSRYCRQNDIIVGVPVDQRMSAAFENVLGCFVNTLPLRADVSADISFVAFLEQVKRTHLADFEHQNIPFDYLVEQLKTKRTEGHSPLVNTFFSLVYENEIPVLELENIVLEAMPILITQAKFDLSFHFFEKASSLDGVVEYRSDLYTSADMRRMSQHFLHLLDCFVTNPTQSIQKVSLLTATEKQKILVDWNKTDVPFPIEKTVYDLFEAQVLLHPDAIAVVEKNRSITYLELHTAASKLACLLMMQGAVKGSLIPIFIERSIELIVGQLAVLKVGAVFVPLNPKTPPKRLRAILEETKPAVCLTKEKLYGHLQDTIGSEKIDISTTVICVDREGFVVDKRLDSSYAVCSEDLAYAIYTSGSTGKPKLVGVKHKSFINLISWHIKEYAISPCDKASVVCSESFDALLFEIYPILAAGASLYIADEEIVQDFAELSTWLKKSYISICFLPTPIVNHLLAENTLRDNVSLKWLLVAGDRLIEFPKEKYRFKIDNLYGPTEATICATKFPLSFSLKKKYGMPPIGKPISNCRLYVLDAYLNPLPVHIPGELYIGGVGVETQYLNNDVLNQEKYIKNPFHAGDENSKLYGTADLVCWLPDGNIQYIGRLDSQLKIRGFRIELGEIENTLLLYPQIEEAIVVVKSSLRANDKYFIAYIRTVQNKAIASASLSHFLKQRLPDYMIPRHFFVLEAFPSTVNGKIDRRALEKLPIQSDPVKNEAPLGLIEKNSPYSILMEALKESLEVASIDPHANFFDMGVHSLMLMQLLGKVNKEIKVKLHIKDFFENATVYQLSEVIKKRISGLSDKLNTDLSPYTNRHQTNEINDIAIIAMSCQFPGSNNPEEFWQHLCQGDETISHFSDQQLREAGISEEVLNDPCYVKARGVVEDTDCFDAHFFNITPREALLMDPQQRVFLEQALIALESAGYCPEKYAGSIGVFAGADESHYLDSVLKRKLGASYDSENFQAVITNATQTFLSTKISYKLGLTGPSLNVHTACSTSLAAIDIACQYLSSRRCDIALVGAVSVKEPQIQGYRYQPESILSPDGHCRAFDKEAAGTVPSAGIGLVVLKRLAEAQREGDAILAVIKSTSTNNDGRQKVGFTAPSISGQAACIRQALQFAHVHPETIGYIETHGTGTILGDPIEVAALSAVFSEKTEAKNFCPIGSVKSNMGHADAAAGMAGLIKTVLMLQNKKIPPSLHYSKSNKNISFKDTAFFVNTKLKNWKKSDAYPRRAGVSAFGIGGTNAHIILEEAPQRETSNASEARKYQVVVLSAKTKEALDIKVQQFHAYLKKISAKKLSSKNVSLENIAFTLQVGRCDFDERYAFICKDIKETIFKIENKRGHFFSINKHDTDKQKPKVVFLFPGQGAQYVQMGSLLYKNEPVFRHAVDRCCVLLRPHLNIDLRDILFSRLDQKKSASCLLKQTDLAQPALFCIEYALVQLYAAWGIHPDVLMGYSFGEITAAYLSGLFSLEDALVLVCARGKLMHHLEKGAMLAVQAPVEKILPLLTDAISIACVNTPQSCTVSGNSAAVDGFKKRLMEKEIIFQVVPISHAFHSEMVEAVIPEFVREVQKITLHQPKIPMISNVTGKWATADQLMDPHYWGQQLRQTVQFSEGVKCIYQTVDNPLFIECGPGNTLTYWVKQHACDSGEHKTVFSMFSATQYEKSIDQDTQTIYAALANIWLYGVDIDWSAYHADAHHQRIALPTYPFEKKRYWPEPVVHVPKINLERDISHCFYQPSWYRLESIDAMQVIDSVNTASYHWIIFARDDAISKKLIKKLHSLKYDFIAIYEGKRFEKIGENAYTIHPKKMETYAKIFLLFSRKIAREYKIIHLWGVDNRMHTFDTFSEILYRGFYSVTFLAKSSLESKLHILLVYDHLHSVFSNEIVCPAKASILGACQVIPLECKNIKITTLDISENKGDLIGPMMAEMLKISFHFEVKHLAYRGGYCWEKTFQPCSWQAEKKLKNPFIIKNKGVYLITGGLGGIGLSLAESLAMSTSAHIALLSRAVLPQPEAWGQWLNKNTPAHPHYSIIKKLVYLKAQGASISVWSADVASYSQMHAVLQAIEKKQGIIQGVVHAAGIAGGGLIQKRSIDEIQRVLRPKIEGAYVLSQLFKTRAIDFILFFSSLTSLTGGVGQLDYAAANASLDAFPAGDFFHAETCVTTINWNAWLEIGMHAEALKTSKNVAIHLYDLYTNNTITPAEGFSALSLFLAHKIKNVAISRIPLNDLIKNTRRQDVSFLLKNSEKTPKNTEIESRSTLEEEIAALFASMLGIEKVQMRDDFFILGGDSLSALSLVDTLEKQYGVRLTLDKMYHIKTPMQLAKYIEASSCSTSKSPLVLLNAKGKTPPLFLVHPVGGTIFCYMPLSRQLEKHRKLYAVQDPGLMDSAYAFDTLELLAGYYVEEIRKVQAHGPYYIGGYSMGGTIAFEIAHQLLQAGEKIHFLGLFDSWATFTDQFHDKHFFEEKMRMHLEKTEEKLTSSVQMNMDIWLDCQWKRMQLLLKYHPRILDCQITLFKAKKLLPEYAAIDDTHNHWQRYSTMPIDTFLTPGDHDTLLSAGYIPLLLDHMLRYFS
jgi:amino acid adenylation domain-containing protein